MSDLTFPREISETQNYTSTMKKKNVRYNNKGFTLLEILTVVAIIGLITSIAIPGYRYARQYAGIVSVKGTVASARSAVDQYLKKPGGLGVLPITESTTLSAIATTGTGASGSTAAIVSAAARLDTLLLTEGFLESPVSIKVGSQVNTPTGTVELLWSPANNAFTSAAVAPSYDYSAITRLECQLVPAAPSVPSAAAGTNFRLDGTNDLQANLRVVALVIPNISGVDAAALANSMGNMSAATATALNNVGPVAYAAPAAGTGLTTAYVYVTSF